MKEENNMREIKGLYLNLPVSKLEASIDFFKKIGFLLVEDYTNDQGACFSLGNGNYLMLLVNEFFNSFTDKEIIDRKLSTEAILSMEVEREDEVDAIVELALANGASQFRDFEEDDFMYVRNFQDLDGHLWEVFSIKKEE